MAIVNSTKLFVLIISVLCFVAAQPDYFISLEEKSNENVTLAADITTIESLEVTTEEPLATTEEPTEEPPTTTDRPIGTTKVPPGLKSVEASIQYICPGVAWTEDWLNATSELFLTISGRLENLTTNVVHKYIHGEVKNWEVEFYEVYYTFTNETSTEPGVANDEDVVTNNNGTVETVLGINVTFSAQLRPQLKVSSAISGIKDGFEKYFEEKHFKFDEMLVQLVELVTSVKPTMKTTPKPTTPKAWKIQFDVSFDVVTGLDWGTDLLNTSSARYVKTADNLEAAAWSLITDCGYEDYYDDTVTTFVQSSKNPNTTEVRMRFSGILYEKKIGPKCVIKLKDVETYTGYKIFKLTVTSESVPFHDIAPTTATEKPEVGTKVVIKFEIKQGLKWSDKLKDKSSPAYMAARKKIEFWVAKFIRKNYPKAKERGFKVSFSQKKKNEDVVDGVEVQVDFVVEDEDTHTDIDKAIHDDISATHDMGGFTVSEPKTEAEVVTPTTTTEEPKATTTEKPKTTTTKKPEVTTTETTEVITTEEPEVTTEETEAWKIQFDVSFDVVTGLDWGTDLLNTSSARYVRALNNVEAAAWSLLTDCEYEDYYDDTVTTFVQSSKNPNTTEVKMGFSGILYEEKIGAICVIKSKDVETYTGYKILKLTVISKSVPFHDIAPTTATEKPEVETKVVMKFEIKQGLKWSDELEDKSSPAYMAAKKKIEFWVAKFIRKNYPKATEKDFEVSFSHKTKNEDVVDGVQVQVDFVVEDEDTHTDIGKAIQDDISATHDMGGFTVSKPKIEAEIITITTTEETEVTTTEETGGGDGGKEDEGETKKKKFPGWAIAIIVISCILIAAIIVFFVYKRNKSSSGDITDSRIELKSSTSRSNY